MRARELAADWNVTDSRRGNGGKGVHGGVGE